MNNIPKTLIEVNKRFRRKSTHRERRKVRWDKGISRNLSEKIKSGAQSKLA